MLFSPARIHPVGAPFKVRSGIRLSLSPDLQQRLGVWMLAQDLPMGSEPQAICELITLATASTLEDAIVENARVRAYHDTARMMRQRFAQFLHELQADMQTGPHGMGDEDNAD